MYVKEATENIPFLGWYLLKV